MTNAIDQIAELSERIGYRADAILGIMISVTSLLNILNLLGGPHWPSLRKPHRPIDRLHSGCPKVPSWVLRQRRDNSGHSVHHSSS